MTGSGVVIRIGALSFRLRSGLGFVADGVHHLYHHHPMSQDGFADFSVEVGPPPSLRRWFGRQACFRHDGASTFLPLPRDQALPLLEWGLNWCVYEHVQDRLVLHAAVVEKEGRALIIPAPPGSGKSTLVAGLSCAGWRLLSDELALLTWTGGQVEGLCRPISLKNASIGVLRGIAGEEPFSPTVTDTLKGDVALMRPPRASVERAEEPARPFAVVFPSFSFGTAPSMMELGPAMAFGKLLENAFNVSALREKGFSALGNLVDHCRCYCIEYGSLAEGMALVQDIHRAGRV
ncbi:HprK-related kinase A [Ectothiorhodospira mobilis]|uniref:HprK-related kinase A n=1 Tax=Ectothiorhodospira mobilis TaxID=195064 RepID=UPI002378ECE5|nr:HprK-related kinase A [Ectothiorhodospira mobilis]